MKNKMNIKHKIELFRANCKLCDYTENELKKATHDCEIIIYRPEDCIDGSCCIKAENYGVNAVTAIIINGKLAITGKTNTEQIKKLLKGR